MVDNGVGVDVERGVGVHRHAHLSDIRVDLVGLVPAIVKGTVSQEEVVVNMCHISQYRSGVPRACNF